MNNCWNPSNRWHNIRKPSIKLQENLSSELNSQIHTDLNPDASPQLPGSSHTQLGHNTVLRKIHWVTGAAFSLDVGPLPWKNKKSLPYLTIFIGVPWLRYPCRMEFCYASHQPDSIPQKPVSEMQEVGIASIFLFLHIWVFSLYPSGLETFFFYYFFLMLMPAQIKAEMSTCTGKNGCEPYPVQGVSQMSSPKDCTTLGQIRLIWQSAMDWTRDA